jgi:hypothetical protein
MADERRLEIRERAGLEEARLNQDFIDFLRKWSTPVLLVFAVAAVGWAFFQRRAQSQQAELSAAFTELEAARSTDNPSPDTLVTIAQTYATSGAVPILARLEAGDIYLDAVRRGMVPGSELTPEGNAKPEDVLSDSARTELLGKAREQFEAAMALATKTPSFSMHKLSAHYGLAAVAESEAHWDKAKASYEAIVALATTLNFSDDVKLAQARIESLPQLAQLSSLPRSDMVPTVLDTTPKPPEPAPAPTTQLPQAGLDLSAPQTPAPTTEPAPEVTPVVTPAVAPAPAPQQPIPGEPKKPE